MSLLYTPLDTRSQGQWGVVLSFPGTFHACCPGHAGWVVNKSWVILEGPVGRVEGSIPVSSKHCVLVGLHYFTEMSVDVSSMSTIKWHVGPTYLGDADPHIHSVTGGTSHWWGVA